MNDINSFALDFLLKKSLKGECNITQALKEKGYNTNLSQSIYVKLIRDGVAQMGPNGTGHINITAYGSVFIKSGGYSWRIIKEYTPPITSIIGCITGVSSFIWLIVKEFL